MIEINPVDLIKFLEESELNTLTVVKHTDDDEVTYEFPQLNKLAGYTALIVDRVMQLTKDYKDIDTDLTLRDFVLMNL